MTRQLDSEGTLALFDHLAHGAVVVRHRVEETVAALVRAELVDQEVLAPKAELVGPVRVVLLVEEANAGPLDANGVEHDARSRALEHHAEQAALPGERLQLELVGAVGNAHFVETRAKLGPSSLDDTHVLAVDAYLEAAAAWLFGIGDDEAGNLAAEVAARRRAEASQRVLFGSKGDAAQAVEAVGRVGPDDAAHLPAGGRVARDVEVKIRGPRVRDEQKSVPAIAEAPLERAPERSRDEIAGDQGIAEMRYARERPGLSRLDARELREEVSKRAATHVDQRDRRDARRRGILGVVSRFGDWSARTPGRGAR